MGHGATEAESRWHGSVGGPCVRPWRVARAWFFPWRTLFLGLTHGRAGACAPRCPVPHTAFSAASRRVGAGTREGLCQACRWGLRALARVV